MLSLLLAGPATAAQTYSVITSGYAPSVTRVCTDATCTSETFNYASSSAPTGTVTLDLADPMALTLGFSLQAASLSLDSVNPSGDNGITDLDLTNLTYTASGLALNQAGNIFFIDGTASPSAVFGADVSENGGTALGLTPNPNPRVTGQCTLNTTLTCGFTFGALFFDFNVGGASRSHQHDIDVTAVPEPTTGLLLAGALGGLALMRRRRA